MTDTAEAYLAALPDDRRAMVEAVRGVILDHLPAGYVETASPGGFSYDVPLEVYPDTYNKTPLNYITLASQKRYVSLYLMGIYVDSARAEAFEREYRATGKRYDVGKSCVRFRTLDDLPLEVVARAVASLDAKSYVELAKATQATRRRR